MRRFGIAVAVAVIALIAAADLIVERLTLDQLRPRVEAQLSEALGLPVSIGGSLSLHLLPLPEIRAESIRVGNLPGRPSPDLLRVGELQLRLELRPLLRRAVAIEAIELFDTELWIEPDENGDWSLPADPDEFDEPESTQDRDPVEMRIDRLTLERLTAYYQPIGDPEAIALRIYELEIEEVDRDHPVALTVDGALEGSDFSFEAQTASLRELLRPTAPFPLEAQGEFLDTTLALRGTIAEPLDLEGLALHFDAAIEDLASLNRDPDRELPELGRVHATGVLEDSRGVLGVRDLSVRTRGAGPVDLVIEGAIANLGAFSGVDLEIRLDAPDAEVFEPFVGVSLPRSAVAAEIEISDEDGSLGVEGEAGTEGRFDLDLRGVLDDVRRLQEVDVQVRLGSTTLATIPDAFGFDPEFPIPTVGPLVASGRLVDRDQGFGVADLDVRLGGGGDITAELRGAIDDVVAFSGLDLHLEVRAKSAREFAALFDVEIPALGPMRAVAFLSDADGQLGVESVELRVGSADRLDLTIAGAFDDLNDFDEVDLEILLEAPSLAVLGDLLDTDLHPLGPLRFRGQIRGSDEALTTRGEARIGSTEFRGEGSASFAEGQKPEVRASLRSREVRLEDLGLVPYPDDEPAAGAVEVDLSEWLDTLDFDRLHDVDLDLRLIIETVTGREFFELRDLHAALRLDDGRLTLEDASAGYQRGRVRADLELNARTLEPTLSAKLEAFNVDLTRVASQLQEEPEYVGLLDLSVNLESRGNTATEWVEGLSGYAGLMLRDGALVTEFSRAFSVDFLRVSVPGFRPRNESPVRCLLALLEVDDGNAEAQSMYLEGDNITVTGVGVIDLARDELDLRLTPHIHKPGLVSVAATVDVSGSLTAPRFRALKRSLGASAARALYKNALRPFKAARSLGRRGEPEALADVDDPCDVVALNRTQHMATEGVEEIDLEQMTVPAESDARLPTEDPTPAPSG